MKDAAILGQVDLFEGRDGAPLLLDRGVGRLLEGALSFVKIQRRSGRRQIQQVRLCADVVHGRLSLGLNVRRQNLRSSLEWLLITLWNRGELLVWAGSRLDLPWLTVTLLKALDALFLISFGGLARVLWALTCDALLDPVLHLLVLVNDLRHNVTAFRG